MAIRTQNNPSVTLIRRLGDFIAHHERLFVLTGAGCSTASGIPDYRDLEGNWKRSSPMTLQQFMGDDLSRARYWARSMIGWRHMADVKPNAAHRALAELEQRGKIGLLVTQNVDRLHQAAGSRNVIDLHGRLDVVRCMDCDLRLPRDEVQAWMEAANPTWMSYSASIAPDGDADLDGMDFSTFTVMPCPRCGGVLKPDVVFFGEGVPKERVTAASAALERADAMLIVGSSLMVFSGYRFAAMAQRLAKPMAAINRGHTRADPLLELKLEADCAETLEAVLALG